MRLAFLVLLSGCGTHALLGGASTLPKGTIEVSAFAGVPAIPGPSRSVAPVALTVQGRYGLTDRVDVGVRFFTTGTSAELRHRIYQAPEGEFPELAALVSIASGFQLASRIGCTFMCRSTSDEPIAFMSLRIPIGITVGRLEVTLAPNGRVELPDTGAWLWAGGQLAATVRLGTWKVGLEGSYLRPVPFFRPALGFESVVLAPEGHVGAVGFKTF